MSDSNQVLAFDSIEEEEATDTSDRAIRWLISGQYICESVSECVYGAESGLGHKPGSRWRDIVDENEERRLWEVWSNRTGQPAPEASETLGEFLALKINGVEASGQRGVVTSGENCGPEQEGVCPACGAKFEPTTDLAEFAERWWQGETCELECPSCLVTSRLEDWDWQPDWAFAQASLTFWNWPPLSAEMISRLSAALDGARIRRVVGRL